MGDNNENPTVQEIPADKCVQRTMAVGSPRPAVKEHSPNMGTKTWRMLIYRFLQLHTVKEHSPNMGTKTSAHAVQLSMTNSLIVKEHSPNMGTKTYSIGLPMPIKLY